MQGRFLILELVDWSWATAMKSQKARMDRIRHCWRAEKGRLLRAGREGVPGSPVARVDVGVCTLGEGPFEKQTW